MPAARASSRPARPHAAPGDTAAGGGAGPGRAGGRHHNRATLSPPGVRLKLLFGLLGAAIGHALDGWPLAFVLGPLGAMAAALWEKAQAARAAADAGIAQRMQALERELATLRRQVQQLMGARSPERADEPPVRPTAAPAAPAVALPPRPASPAAAAPQASRVAAPQAIPVAAPRRARPAPAPVQPLRDRLPPFVARWIFGGNTIVKIGVLLLFLGLAFLLRYTAERVSLPVEFRYAGVALAGAVLLALGWRLRDRRDADGGTQYGLILQGAGIGVFYLTALAALRLHPLLTPPPAFGLMVAVASAGALLALAQDAPWLALVSVAEGFAAPVLVSTGSNEYAALMTYLLILDAGILAMAWFKAWRALNLVGAVATFALAGAWAKAHYVAADHAGVQAFLALFFLLFTATGVLYARRALAAGDPPPPQHPLAERAAAALRQVGRVDSTLTFGVPLAAFTLQYLLVRDMPWGPAWAASAFALFHLALGTLLMRGANTRFALLGEAHVIVGTIFATLAIALALEGRWTGATWAIEAAGMYWLGARQQRTYARAFALLVVTGAALRLLAGVAVDPAAGTPLLTGSVPGMAMLAAALLAMDAVRRGLGAPPRSNVEEIAALGLPFGAALALALLAWRVLPVPWAGAATAWLAFACAALQERLRAPCLRVAGVLLHLVALSTLTTTALVTHVVADQAPRPEQWRDLGAALLVGGALLATGWLGVRASWDGAPRAAPERWSAAGGVGLFAGVAVLAASLLLVIAPERAALAWPALGVLALGAGARLRHPALVLAGFALQAAAAAALLLHGPSPWGAPRSAALLDQPGCGALLLALAALVIGDLLRRAAQSAPADRAAPWWHAVATQALNIAWAGLWWSQALPPLIQRRLEAGGWLAAWPNWLGLWLTLSSVAALVLARWRRWTVLGQATRATVPLWIGLAATGPLADGAAPSADLGWLAWPLAFAWHLALPRLQAPWRAPRLDAPLRVLGLWLFVALATRECALRLAQFGAPGSGWAELGALAVPALVLIALARPSALRRALFGPHDDACRLAGCGPLALYVFTRLWAGNATPGDAAPLPWLPLLNPLEIGLALAVSGLVAWARSLTPPQRAAVPRALPASLAGATALALVTGAVLRACHQLAGVPWGEHALWTSTLAQAALTVVWSLIGVALMLAGHRAARRVPWLAGAALLALVVAKLFLVQLADHGGLARIVSFLVVGVLMLVVGYFAPLPPRRAQAGEAVAAP